MRIRITRGTVAKAQSQPIGAEIEVDSGEGEFLIAIGKAVEILGEPEAPAPAPVEDAPPEVPENIKEPEQQAPRKRRGRRNKKDD